MKDQRKYYIVGNWKMNPGNKKEALRIFNGIKKRSQRRSINIVICPPFLYLSDLSSKRLPKSLSLGAQNCFWEKGGSYTGEVSSDQLADMKVKYVIVGHSERREMWESDEDISKKIKASLRSGINPIICAGEKERDRDGEYLRFLESQLKFAFSEVTPALLKRVIVAYEPVWAIGKSEDEAITGHQLYEIVVFIKRFLSKRYGKKEGFSVPVLYGGSVSPRNTEEFLKEGHAEGLLIGRQSLDPKSFSEIIDIAESI